MADGDGSVETEPDIVKFGEELLSLLSLLGQRLRAGHRLRPDPAVELGLSRPANINIHQSSSGCHLIRLGLV